MPRALEPGMEFEIVLDSDAEKPAGARPTFVYRSINGREWRSIAAITDRMEAGGFSSGGDALDVIYQACSTGLVSWRNMYGPDGEIEFNASDLDLVIDPMEAKELMFKVMSEMQVTSEDKKKLELQVSSGMT